MSSSPDITVVIPYLDQPEELSRVLEDLLAQQSVSLEAFVIDDASKIFCDNIVADAQNKGLDVALLRQPERRYTLQARLRGMRQARGRWLAFMGADDRLCGSDVYARAVKAADKSQADILHYITLAADDGGRLYTWKNASPFSEIPLTGHNLFDTWIRKDCPAHSVWNKLYSRSLYQRVAQENHDLQILRMEDLWLTSHFVFYAHSYEPCTIPVYRYQPPYNWHLQKLAARAIDALRMYLALPPRFIAEGLSPESAEIFKNCLRKQVTLNAGSMCHICPKTDDGITFSPNAIADIRKYGTDREFFLALAIANACNARKLQGIFGSLL